MSFRTMYESMCYDVSYLKMYESMWYDVSYDVCYVYDVYMKLLLI